MSDEPRRQLGGLASLSRMKGTGTAEPATAAPAATTAPAPAPQPATVAESPKAPVEAVSAPQAAERAPTRPESRTAAPKAAQRPNPPTEGSPQKMSVYIAPSKRARAKAAYLATGHLEGEPSFSEFVSAAIEREVVRREGLYNGGQPYAGDSGRLTAGRPLS